MVIADDDDDDHDVDEDIDHDNDDDDDATADDIDDIADDDDDIADTRYVKHAPDNLSLSCYKLQCRCHTCSCC